MNGEDIEQEELNVGQVNPGADAPRRIRVLRREGVPQGQEPVEPPRGAGRGRGVQHASGRGRAARRPEERDGIRDGQGNPDLVREGAARGGREGGWQRPPPVVININAGGNGGNPGGHAGAAPAANPIPPNGGPVPAGNPDPPGEELAVEEIEYPERGEAWADLVQDTDWELDTFWFSSPYYVACTVLVLAMVLGSALFDEFYLLVVLAVFAGVGVRRKYRYLGRFHRRHGDLRPEANALLDLRHEPRYGMIGITAFVHFFGIEVPIAWLASYWSDTLYVSLEMVSQIATDVNLALSANEEVAWLRIVAAMRSLHVVNYDRYLSLGRINVKQDTSRYLFALYRKMHADAAEDFPQPEL